MQLKCNDRVFLNRDAPVADTPATPKFGGKFGMVYGTVTKVITGSHDPTKHNARVDWDNGHKWNLAESFLTVVTPSTAPLVSPTEGIVLFMRPTDGFQGVKIGLVADDFTPSSTDKTWVSIKTRRTISVSLLDEKNLYETMFSMQPECSNHTCSITAVNSILHENGFPPVRLADIQKLPLFQSFSEALQNEATGDSRLAGTRGYVMFTIPQQT